MSTNAEIGLGTIFKIGGVAVAEIVSINPSITSGEDDVTDMDSTALWTDWIKLPKTVDLNLETHFRPAIQDVDILAYLNDTTAGGLSMRIEWSDGATVWAFYGLVQDSDITGPHANKMTNNVRIRVTGSIDFSA